MEGGRSTLTPSDYLQEGKGSRTNSQTAYGAMHVFSINCRRSRQKGIDHKEVPSTQDDEGGSILSGTLSYDSMHQ